MQATGERRLPRGGPPAPPPAIQAGIASGSAPALRHKPAAWRASGSSGCGALEDPGDFGEQVGAAACEVTELGHRSGFLVAVQVAPPGAAARLAVKLGDEQPVSLRALIDHMFKLARLHL